ncbi:MAG: CvpA family protein [Clostridia bacterium]|nr:CvpA family protein [Clostridia bacterium]
MGVVVDLIIIAIIVLSTFLAYQKGLVKLAIGLCAFAISIVITVILYQPISNLVINVTTIDEMIEDAIYEKANGVIQENTDEEGLTSQMIQSAKDGMLPEVAREMAINIVRGGVMIVLFVATKIALKFITALADAIAKLPIVDQLNKTSGMIFGIFRGILIVYVGLLILAIPGQINPNNKINSSVEQSLLGKTMYENNILNIFF